MPNPDYTASVAPDTAAVHDRHQVTPFFLRARSERVAFIGIGDSNQLENGNGWDEGVQDALAYNGGLWGSGVFPMLASGEFANMGYRCNPAFSGDPTSFSSGAPTNLAQFMPPNPGRPGYTYQGTGAFGFNCLIETQYNWAPVEQGNLRLNFTYGVSSGWSGNFQPGLRRGGLPDSTELVAGTLLSTGGTATALIDGFFDVDLTTQPTVDLEFRLVSISGGTSGAGVGPFFGTHWSVENSDKRSGFSYQTFVYHNGGSLRDMGNDLAAIGAPGRQEFLRQCARLCGPSKFACVLINSGFNDLADTSSSLGPNPAASDTAAGYADNLTYILGLLTSDWAALGYPAASLFFVLMPSHPVSTPDNATLVAYRAAADGVADANPRTCSVHLDHLSTFNEMLAHNDYNGGQSPGNGYHLSQTGYYWMGNKVVQSLAATLEETVGDAAAAVVLPMLPHGRGDTPVDHDTGGTDALRVLAFGVGVDRAILRAYLQGDYTADRATAALLGSTVTLPDGRWATPIFLAHGFTYTIVAEKPGLFGPQTMSVTI